MSPPVPVKMIINSPDENATWEIGRQLAECLTAGITIALNAELGSGKTHLTRAVCHGLGIDESSVNSPTFVLMQVYAGGRIPVAHFDTYRLADVDEFLAIGAEEYLTDETTICFVEWADRIREVLPDDHLQIEIEQTGESERALHFEATGPKSSDVLTRLQSLRNRD